MEIGTQIRVLTKDVTAAAACWDDMQIKSSLEKNVDSLCQKIFRAINAYDKVEKSSNRRAEILGNLSSALKDLAVRVGGVKSWSQRILAYAGFGLSRSEKHLWTQIKAVESCKDRQTRFFLIRFLQAFWDAFCLGIRKRILLDSSVSAAYRFKECAFRTVRNLRIMESLLLDPTLPNAPPTLLYRSVQKDLKQFQDEQGMQLETRQQAEIQKLIEQLKFAEEIAFYQDHIWVTSHLDSQRTREEKTANLAYEIEKQIEHLGIGENLLFPGGYVNGNVGHAVAFEIKRIDADNFQFLIYNTGEGADLGQGLWSTIKMLLFWETDSIAFQNLTKEAASDQSFLMDVLRQMVDSTSKSNSMGKLFSTVREHCVDQHKAIEKRLGRHELQSWGTCTYDSIRSYLKAKLDPALFARLEGHTIQKAHEQLMKLLPEIRSSRAFNSDTLDLVESKSKESISKLLPLKLA